jgi:hypothetical protein
MDRAWLVRVICRPLLLAALTIQSMTPSLLDDTLLEQSLPPGPVFLVSMLAAPASEGEGEAAAGRFPTRFLAARQAALPSFDDDGSSGVLCKSYWPVLGMTQTRTAASTARPAVRTDLVPGPFPRIEAVPAARWQTSPPSLPGLPLLLCRFLC